MSIPLLVAVISPFVLHGFRVKLIISALPCRKMSFEARGKSPEAWAKKISYEIFSKVVNFFQKVVTKILRGVSLSRQRVISWVTRLVR